MLPGPTNVPERVTRAMFTHMINHRSSDFVELYEDAVEKTKKFFKPMETQYVFQHQEQVLSKQVL